MNRPTILRPCLGLGIVVLLVVTLGCSKKKPCVDKSKPALDQCTEKAKRLQDEVNKLKGQLAQALTNPGSIKIDPSALEIEGKLPTPGKRRVVREGNISQEQVLRTLTQNKSSLQPCYNRALKRDSSLHHRKLVLNLSLKIRSTGNPSEVALRPNYDGRMVDCMMKAIRRWRFPQFSGAAVVVESPLTFKPTK